MALANGASGPSQMTLSAPPQETAYLPDEIVLEVLSYIPRNSVAQRDLWAFCLVNRQWYRAAIARLYEEPNLEGPNFDLFVRTICPSINLHVKKSDLSGLVRILNLERIVHQSSKSVTARLLGRTKKSLEVFVAPQASFAINCFAALSKCTNLHTLDLSLICEAVSIQALAHTMKQLPKLRVLYFPRTSNDSQFFDSGSIAWPHLEKLYLSGSIHGNFVRRIVDISTGKCRLPSSLTTLSITHCPNLGTVDLLQLLQTAGPQLEALTVEQIRGLDHRAMDHVLDICQKLKFLRVSLDYVTFMLLEPSERQFTSHPLERLELSSSGDVGSGLDHSEELEAGDIYDAIFEGVTPNLRIVRVTKSARWHLEDEETIRTILQLMEERFAKRKAADPSIGKKLVGMYPLERCPLCMVSCCIGGWADGYDWRCLWDDELIEYPCWPYYQTKFFAALGDWTDAYGAEIWTQIIHGSINYDATDG